jgi:hypothetical protein
LGAVASLSLILLCGVRGRAGAELVVRTLSAFVTASVNGLLRDAALAGPAQDDLAFIAEHAGCTLVEAEKETDALGQAIALSRGTDLFILHAGHVPEMGSLEAIGDLVASARSARRGWLLRASPDSPVERLFPRLAPAVGLIAARERCAGVQVPSFGNLRKATRARTAPHFHLRRIL